MTGPDSPPPPPGPGRDVIVTVTPTVMAGTVVRWYGSLGAAENRDEMVSASRDGVLVHEFLHRVPREVLDKANEAFEILRDNGPRELVADWATHRRRGWLLPLEPIDRQASHV